MAASLERGDVTGYNKRFAEHSVARETVPFSAWKQSRGLLSWTISVVGAQAKGRTSNFFFSVCYGIQLREKRCRSSSTLPTEGMGGRGKDRGQQARASSLPFPREFRFALKRNALCTSGYEWIRFMNHFENYLWDIGWKDGWMEVLVDCITIIGFSNFEFLG